MLIHALNYKLSIYSLIVSGEFYTLTTHSTQQSGLEGA